MAERKEFENVVKLDEFPGNSHKSKERTEIVKSKKIIKGTVKKRKPSLGKKMKDEFISTDSHSVMSYLLEDVFIPAAKETIANIVSGGIEMILFGGSSSDRGSNRQRNKSRVSYESYYDRKESRYSNRNRSSVQSFDEVIFDSRVEAEDVLSAMIDDIDEYGITTVGNFYDLIGERTTPSDFKWGWETLRSARIDRVRDGYVISLPRVVAVD